MNDIIQQLDKIQNLSAAVMVLGVCIVVGYILRFIKSFPNDGIPLVVILTGALAFCLLADPRVATMSARVWITRNIIAGLIIGFLAWMSHKLIVSKLEDFLASRFDVVARVLGNGAKNEPPVEPPKNP